MAKSIPQRLSPRTSVKTLHPTADMLLRMRTLTRYGTKISHRDFEAKRLMGKTRASPPPLSALRKRCLTPTRRQNAL